MGMSVTARRRWLGVIVLGAAVAMLLLGQTLLKNQLSDAAFLLYWMCCFGLTGLAVLIALWDVRALQRRTHQDARDLLQSTLTEIQLQAQQRKQKTPGRNSQPKP